jgi:hypothetical protein
LSLSEAVLAVLFFKHSSALLLSISMSSANTYFRK